MRAGTLYIFVSLVPLAGCGLGFLDEYAEVPVCDSQGGTDPECVDPSSAGVTEPTTPDASGISAVPTESGNLTSDTTGDLPSTSDPASSTGTTTAGGPAEPPMIVTFSLDPDELVEAGPIAVQVEALHADEVTVAVNDGEAVALESLGEGAYVGTIEVIGATMNGPNTATITASREGLSDVEVAPFTVDAPPPGENIWVETSSIPSQGVAIAVDADSNVFEVGTIGAGPSAALVYSKRDVHGAHAWPGAWISPLSEESRGQDIAVGPDGVVHVLGNFKDGEGENRWWLASVDPGLGIVLDEKIGQVGETAHGLDVSSDGDRVIVGTVDSVADGVQTRVWYRPLGGSGWIHDWGHDVDLEALFDDVPADVVITDERIFVTGSSEGAQHLDAPNYFLRKRLFVIELSFQAQVVRSYVAGGTPYPRSGGAAIARDGEGGVVTAGWACEDACMRVGEILWFGGDGELAPYARHVEESEKDLGPAHAAAIAYSPAGYHVVVSSVYTAPGNLGTRVAGHRPDTIEPVFTNLFDTSEAELGQSAAVGPYGFLWFGGTRVVSGTLRAFVGRSHG